MLFAQFILNENNGREDRCPPFRYALGKNIRISSRSSAYRASMVPTAKVVRPLNKAALSRVFGNILGNALKYSGGDLGVTLLETGEAVFSNAAPG